MGDLGSISGLGRSSGEGKGYPLQYSGLDSSMDCIVLWVVKSQTRLSDFHFTLELDFQGGSVVVNSLPMQKMWVRSLGWEDLLEKEMATHSDILA